MPEPGTLVFIGFGISLCVILRAIYRGHETGRMVTIPDFLDRKSALHKTAVRVFGLNALGIALVAAGLILRR